MAAAYSRSGDISEHWGRRGLSSNEPPAYSARVPSDGVREAERDGDVRALVGLLSATTPLTRIGAAHALGRLGDPAAVEPLIKCLRAHDDPLRVSVLKALARIDDHSSIPAVMAVALADDASGVRATAIDTLATLRDPEGVQMLAQLAVDPTPLLGSAERTFSLWVGGRWRPKIRPRNTQKWALKRLRQLRAVEAIPRLQAARPPRDPFLRLHFRRTLHALRG